MDASLKADTLTLTGVVAFGDLAKTRSANVRDLNRLMTDSAKLQTHIDSPLNTEEAKQLAAAIGDALLPDDLLEIMEAAVVKGAHHITISLRADDDASSIPWELAWIDPISPLTEDGSFIGLNPAFTVFREVDVAARTPQMPPDRLRLLIAWADPNAGSALSQAKHESDTICNVIASSPECRHVDVGVVPSASYGKLLEEMNQFQPHVLHFIGHCDDASGLMDPALIVHSENGTARLTARALASAPGFYNLRMAVLSACNTSKIAAELAGHGLSVIATQAPWRDSAGVAYSRALYSALTYGSSLASAATGAQRAIANFGLDWAAVALYSHKSALHQQWMAAPEPPHNLPHKPASHFHGRDADLQTLSETMDTGPAAHVLLCGLPGMGKSHLASEYAHRSKWQYPGGVFWIRAADIDSLRGSFTELADWFEVPDHYSDRATEVWKRLNASTARTLFIFDNVTELSAQLYHWFPTGSNCYVIATARKPHSLDTRMQMLDLKPLSSSDAEALLQIRREASDVEEHHAVKEIAKTLGRVPLALSLAAHHCARLNLSFEGYMQRLQLAPLKTMALARDKFNGTTGHDGHVLDAIAISVNGVSEYARKLLTAAACFAEEPIDKAVLIEAAGLPRNADPDLLLAELRDQWLLAPSHHTHVVLHELVRRYVRAANRPAVMKRALFRTANTLNHNMQRLIENARWKEAYALTQHASEVLLLCRVYPMPDIEVHLLYSTGKVRFQMADYDGAIEDFQQVLNLEQALSPEMRAETLRQLGDVYYGKSNQMLEARHYFTEAYELAKTCRPSGDMLILQCQNSLAAIDKRGGNNNKAIAEYRKILSVITKQQHPDRHFEATVHNNIGNALEALYHAEQEKEKLEEAIACYDHAMEIERTCTSPDPTSLSAFYDSRGRCLLALTRFEEAIESHLKALQLNQEALGANHPYCAASYFYLGEVYASQGRADLALGHYWSSLEIYKRCYTINHERPQRVLQRIRDVQKQNLDTAG